MTLETSKRLSCFITSEPAPGALVTELNFAICSGEGDEVSIHISPSSLPEVRRFLTSLVHLLCSLRSSFRQNSILLDAGSVSVEASEKRSSPHIDEVHEELKKDRSSAWSEKSSDFLLVNSDKL